MHLKLPRSVKAKGFKLYVGKEPVIKLAVGVNFIDVKDQSSPSGSTGSGIVNVLTSLIAKDISYRAGINPGGA